MKGRQILWMVYQWYEISDIHGQMLDRGALYKVKCRESYLRAFQAEWKVSTQR